VRLLTAAAALAAGAGAVAQSQYSVTQIPSRSIDAIAMTDNGLAVGSEGEVWHESFGVQRIPLPGNHTNVHTRGASDGGIVVGKGLGGNTPSPFRWSQAEGTVPILGLPLPTRLWDVSDSGYVVGEDISLGGERSFRWHEDTGMVTLRALRAGDNVEASQVNEHGEAAGWSSDTTSGQFRQDAVFWRADGTVVPMGTLGTDWQYWTHDISNTSIVVGASSGWGAVQGYIWDGQRGMRKLVNPLFPFHWSDAMGVNDAGEAVGEASDGTRLRGSFWDADGRLSFLDDHLAPGHEGWRIMQARDIANTGQIVGWGYNPDGQFANVVLTPVPEPSALLALACALPLLARRKRG
jgi:hypothetical protein